MCNQPLTAVHLLNVSRACPPATSAISMGAYCRSSAGDLPLSQLRLVPRGLMTVYCGFSHLPTSLNWVELQGHELVG